MRNGVWGAWRIFGLVLCVCVVAILAAKGQTAATGALAGTVTDQTGAVVANAKVTATSETGQVRQGTTGSDGTYKFGLLAPGTYQVKFEASGFKAVEVPATKITVTETAVLDGHLEVGVQTQEVTVTTEVEAIQTSSSTLGTVLASREVTDIPLSTRNYTNLLSLSAGANASVNNATALGKGSQDIATNGSSTGQNNYQMDGVAINNFTGFGRTAETGFYGSFAVPPPDAIQEFKIQTSTYDASYGRNPGANVDVVTKSGTNEWHGAAFEFFRNTSLNANDFFYKRSEVQRGLSNKQPVLNQNQFGGVIGGPIKKDKLFVFVSYQETEQKNGLASFGFSSGIRFPALGSANSGFNASGSRGGFASGFTPSACPDGQVLTCLNPAGVAFVNQLGAVYGINAANINPVAVAILQLQLGGGRYYVPGSGASVPTSLNSPALALTSPAIFHEHQGIGNWDYIINEKHTLSGRYLFSTEPTTAGFGNFGTTSGALTGAPVNVTYGAQEAVLKLTSLVTPNFVNELRGSFQRNSTDNSNAEPFTNNQVGIASVTPTFNQLDSITITSLFNIGGNQLLFETLRTNQFQLADQISWTHSKHTIRAGFEGERIYNSYNSPGLSIGSITFNTFPDFLTGQPGCPAPGGAPCNASGSSSLANNSGITTRVPNVGLLHEFRVNNYDAFIQDDLKIASRLTLNLGLRWEFDGLVWDATGDATNFWPSLVQNVPVPGNSAATGTLTGFVVPSNYSFTPTVTNPVPAPPSGIAGLFQNTQKIPSREHPPYDNFAPRIGFAWQPLSTNRLVLRGGFGYFYDRVPGDTLEHGINQGEPYAITAGSFGPPSLPQTTSLANPYGGQPQLGWADRWINFATGAYSALAPVGVAEVFQTPLVYQWNLNSQYEFAPRWVLELGYVGTHGIHQAIQGDPVNLATLASPTHPINGSIFNSAGFAPLPGPPQTRVPLLGFVPSLTSTTTVLNYKYNSLQATVRKQFSHGFTFQTAYTWSRAFASNFYANPNATTPGVLPAENVYAPNPLYHPSRLTFNYAWDLPTGQHSGLADKVLGGWNLSGVTVVQNGQPLDFTYSAGPTGGGTVFGTPVASQVQLASKGGCTANGFCASTVPVGTPGDLYQRAQTGYLNQAAFTGAPLAQVSCVAPAGPFTCGTFNGNSYPGLILGPGQFNWDVALVKTTKVGGLREDATLQFRTEFFNTFNHTQFSNPGNAAGGNNPVTYNPSAPGAFGTITSASVNPRLIQFALKYVF